MRAIELFKRQEHVRRSEPTELVQVQMKQAEQGRGCGWDWSAVGARVCRVAAFVEDGGIDQVLGPVRMRCEVIVNDVR